jgi:hypothetical protein
MVIHGTIAAANLQSHGNNGHKFYPTTCSQTLAVSSLPLPGTNPYALVDEAVCQAATLSGGAKPLHTKRLPATIDVFGWCSWDSYYSSVSAQGKGARHVCVMGIGGEGG